MIYWQLFKVFFLTGAFSFGGGLVSIELIRSRVVTQYGWLTNAEFADILSISEMTPGPIGINAASFVGTRIAGIPGTVVATLSYVLPAVMIVGILSTLYFKYRSLDGMQGFLKGLRPAVAAMVMSTATKLAGNALWGGLEQFSLPDTNLVAAAVCVMMVVLLRANKLGPVQAILASGVIGAVAYAALGMPV